MVLQIRIGDKDVIFGNDEIKQLLGFTNIPNELCDSVSKIKKYITNILYNYNFENTELKIKFNDKKMYNHIKFYEYIGIRLNIEFVKNNGKYKTLIYYEDTIIHKCHKDIEVYFNFLILSEFEKHNKFLYLFFNDSKLFNGDLVEIDMCNIYNNHKSKERFDMKIKIKDNISFALECFENHHEKKYDVDYSYEVCRLITK